MYMHMHICRIINRSALYHASAWLAAESAVCLVLYIPIRSQCSATQVLTKLAVARYF